MTMRPYIYIYGCMTLGIAHQEFPTGGSGAGLGAFFGFRVRV